MQLRSSFSRLAAFALFLLSFSLLVCAAPAPVPAANSGALAVRHSSLVARTDYTNTFGVLVAKLKVEIGAELDVLVESSKTPGSDVKPIIAKIVLLIEDFIATVKAQIKLGATIDVEVAVKLIIDLIISILIKLKLVIKLSADLFVKLDAALKALVDLVISLTLDVALKITLLLKIKVAVSVYLDVVVKLSLKLLADVLGLVLV